MPPHERESIYVCMYLYVTGAQESGMSYDKRQVVIIHRELISEWKRLNEWMASSELKQNK